MTRKSFQNVDAVFFDVGGTLVVSGTRDPVDLHVDALARLGTSQPRQAVLAAYETATRAFENPRALMVGDDYRLDVCPALEIGMHAVLVDRRGRSTPIRSPQARRLSELRLWLVD